ncbi:hypothetical protein ARMSODRAFT_982981 [Armillaria solidipes]|uniref:Peptidase C14 caspase domain-containing protein n=1 Tax=Armillaria solidipes TaxID=1076256 RepID=A0A2H3B6M6_9AGAR|nr:hypothetical protein ARMSODRAFT_982981 [Armillaria solidipes]
MLYLVTGCSKCRSWANACYSHTVESRAASLNLSIAGGGANVSGTLYCKWEVQSDSPVHHRSHPEPPASVPYALIPHALAAVALIPLSLIAPSLTPALVVAAVLLRRYPNPPNLPEATENQTIFLHGFSISVYEKSAMKFRLKEKVKLREKPPQDSSIPYSAAPQSSTTPAATETGTAQGHGAGMERGTARSLNFDDSEIEGSSYDEYSGSGGSESLEDETETDVPAMDIPYGYTTMQADTLVQRLPGWGKIVNPSALINKHILDTYPDVTIALTHDDFEWTGMENNVRNPLNVMGLAKYAIDNNLVSINESETTPNAWVAKRRDIIIDRFPRQNDIFALVIGIDKYQCKEYKDLQGACSDADKFEAYLVEALGTPKANIISLRDEHATRSAIIDKLIRMKDNADMQRDTAAIVIYFAGYGAATTDPVGRADGNTSNEKIGMLCPTDIGVLDKSGDVVNGILARTINQLLLELSLAHGNNITLILDCSYAALPSDTQKPADMPAGAERRQIFDPPKLSPSCDQQIYSGPGKKPVPEFGSSLLDSPLQFAYESQGGGLFTRALLKVMKERPIGNLTYKSLVHRLDMPGYQTPLSEGIHINRRLFDSRGTA